MEEEEDFEKWKWKWKWKWKAVPSLLLVRFVVAEVQVRRLMMMMMMMMMMMLTMIEERLPLVRDLELWVGREDVLKMRFVLFWPATDHRALNLNRSLKLQNSVGGECLGTAIRFASHVM